MPMALNSEVLELDVSDDEAVENSLTVEKRVSDSSDEESETPNLNKKRRRPRLADLANEDGDGESSNSPKLTGIYSNRVSTVVDEMKSGKFKSVASPDSDVEDEDDNFLLPQSKRMKIENNCSSTHIPDELLILDSDEEGETISIQNEVEGKGNDIVDLVTRSPSPPPTPPSDVSLTRPLRRNKAVTKAIRNLEKVSHGYHESQADRSLNDSIDLVLDSPFESRSMMVKVRSTTGVQRFPLKPNDTFEGILKMMALKEGVPLDRVFMVHRDDAEVQPYDTPQSIKLHIADILDFHVRQSAQPESEVNEQVIDSSCIKVKVQGMDRHTILVIAIKKTNPLEGLMREYASRKELDYSSLKFQFDGEDIDPKDTPEDLDMDDDDCIDVVQL